jgi:hypothetical protein
LTAFLTDFRAFLLACTVLDAIDAIEEGDEWNESADEEHEECDIVRSLCMVTDQDVENLLVIQQRGKKSECQNESRKMGSFYRAGDSLCMLYPV